MIFIIMVKTKNYYIFINENLNKIKEQYPHFDKKETNYELSRLWKKSKKELYKKYRREVINSEDEE